MPRASRDTKSVREMMNYPFELMVGLVSLLPPLLIGLDPGTYDELRIVAELNIVFATAWATICIVGGCAVLWGLRSDLIPPIAVGLRLTSLGWVTFFIISRSVLVSLLALSITARLGGDPRKPHPQSHRPSRLG